MNNLKGYLITGLVAVVVALGLGYFLPHSAVKTVVDTAAQKAESFAGTVENYPVYFYNGLSAGNKSTNGISGTNFQIDANGDILQAPGVTAALGAVIQNSGILNFATSTIVTGAQFCTSGMIVIPNTVTTNITFTLPSLATIAASPCGSSIYAGGFSQQMIVNLSNFFVTEQLSASNTNESLIYSKGSSSVLPPGHTWVNYGQFVNPNGVVPGATNASTTLQVSVIDTQAGTEANATSTLASSWVGHMLLPAGGATISASTTAVSNANSAVSVQQELTTPLAGVTCNSTIATDTAVTVLYNASTTLTGFKLTTTAAPVTNPNCYSFEVNN